MAHHNTVFSQLLKLVPRHEFEALANRHHQGRKLRKVTRWSQLVAMATAQLSGRASLRDVVTTLSAQAAKLYHLGATLSGSRTSSIRSMPRPSTCVSASFPGPDSAPPRAR